MLFEQVLDILSSVDFYQSMFRLATPLMLASMGTLFQKEVVYSICPLKV